VCRGWSLVGVMSGGNQGDLTQQLVEHWKAQGNPEQEELFADEPCEEDAEGYWCKRLPWYPNGCFGPYRSSEQGYSRRELAADGAIHVIGVLSGIVGSAALVTSSIVHQSPLEIKLSLVVYCASFLTMVTCSATFNFLAWSKHIWALQLADHIGILFLIAGSYTPFMTLACCPRTLAFVWILAVVSTAAKASRSKFDVLALHVPCFLLMGWCILIVWKDISTVITLWARHLMELGGILYSAGLIPWAMKKLEFHNAIWHVCVLVASGCFFITMHFEVSQPRNWKAVESGVCQGQLF